MVDEAAKAYVQSVLAEVPDRSGDLHTVLRRGSIRRKVLNTAVGGGALIVLVLVMSPLLLTMGRSDTQVVGAGSGGLPAVELPDGFVVGVDGEPVETLGALVYWGLPAEAPTFDPTSLGTEVVIQRQGPSHLVVPPSDQPFESNALGASTLVYLGDVGNFQLALSVSEGRELCIFFGNGTEITGGGYCGLKPTPESGFSADPTPKGWWLVWSKLPKGTAIVQIELPDGSTYWQRPVARTVFFQVSEPGTLAGTRTIALDTQGNVLAVEEASYLEGHENFDAQGNLVDD